MPFRGRGGGSFRGRGGGGSFRGRGGGGRRFDDGPPESVIEVGTVMHPCQEDLVCRCTNYMVPYFNAPIYLENKSRIGKIDEIFGQIRDFYFSIKMDDNMLASSFSKNSKFYIDPRKLLPLEKFTAPASGKVSKPASGGRGRGGFRGRGGGSRGGRGGGRGGGGGGGGGFRGRGRGGGGGGGGFRGRGGGGGFRGGGGGGGGGGGFKRGGGGFRRN